MKYLLKAPVIKNNKIAPELFELILKAPEIAKSSKPGQFVQIKVTDDLNPLLPRPFSLSYANTKTDCIAVIYKIIGKGTQILSQRQKGEILTVTGPLGNSFWIEPGVKHIALIAGGTGIGPIIFLTKILHNKTTYQTFAFLGARSKKMLYGYEQLKNYCEQIFCSTDDGSYGRQGFVTDLFEEKCQKLKIDQVIAVGPIPMMKKVVIIAHKLHISSLISLEERMACGFGICMGCAVKLADGKHHLACCDGPVFRGEDVEWSLFEN
ncbi:MAG: dihydroorotate dehydrogenase electron transfer subunit [Patescibacteria group bacterium]